MRRCAKLRPASSQPRRRRLASSEHPLVEQPTSTWLTGESIAQDAKCYTWQQWLTECAQVESSGRPALHLGLLRRILVRQSQGREPNVSLNPFDSTLWTFYMQKGEDMEHTMVTKLTARQCLALNPDPLGLELLPHVGCVFSLTSSACCSNSYCNSHYLPRPVAPSHQPRPKRHQTRVRPPGRTTLLNKSPTSTEKGGVSVRERRSRRSCCWHSIHGIGVACVFFFGRYTVAYHS